MMYLLIHKKHHVLHHEKPQNPADFFFLGFKIHDVLNIIFSVFRCFAIQDVRKGRQKKKNPTLT